MSSCRQWKIGSDVNSSAKIQPIAQISEKSQRILSRIQTDSLKYTQCTTYRLLWCSVLPRAVVRGLGTRM